jgi:hypothetical protein
MSEPQNSHPTFLNFPKRPGDGNSKEITNSLVSHWKQELLEALGIYVNGENL